MAAIICEHKRCKRKQIEILVCKDCGAAFTREEHGISIITRRIADNLKKSNTKIEEIYW